MDIIAAMRPLSGPVLGRPLVFFLLFGLFLLVYAVTPLWIRLPGAASRAAFLAAVLLAGGAWAWWASGSLALPRLRHPRLFYGCLAFAALLELPALLASIPWRGDEDHHIVFTWDLARALASRPGYLLLPLFPLLWGRFAPPRPAWILAGAALLAGLALLVGFTADVPAPPEDVDYHVLRYPILLKYVAAVPVYLAGLVPLGAPEWPYRLLPVLSAGLLAWVAGRALRRRPKLLWISAGALVLSLPLVRYYASIFYLEMPAVLLMAVACFRADELLRGDPDRLVRKPAWYALLLVGFIKETTLPFLAAFSAFRLLARAPGLLRSRSPGPWLDEARVHFCTGLPLLLYLACRAGFGDPRPAGLHVPNLWHPEFALRLAHSLWDSFGPLLPMACLGFAALLRRGKRLVPLFLASTALLNAALHYLDDYNFIGYSRFNLFLLPGLLALGWESLRWPSARSRRPAIAVLTVAGLLCALLNPVFPDGSKRPFWGVYGVDTGEHYYPHRQAFAALAERYPGEKALFTGHHYLYLARFYTGTRDWPVQSLLPHPPADGAAALDSVLASAAAEGYAAVLWQVTGEWREPEKRHGFDRMVVFRNRAHVLVLFGR